MEERHAACVGVQDGPPGPAARGQGVDQPGHGAVQRPERGNNAAIAFMHPALEDRVQPGHTGQIQDPRSLRPVLGWAVPLLPCPRREAGGLSRRRGVKPARLLSAERLRFPGTQGHGHIAGTRGWSWGGRGNGPTLGSGR